ncbi:DUF4127 family protein [Micromonospora sp. NPDC048063]|uniref:DUF4127 family protein n=1 Tax=Micromonospora sp. NPDC048063 TaxID=3364256 RepID=UPI00371D0740
MTRVALLPPDERPNTRGYAVAIGACAGLDVVTPPPAAMPSFRRPADTAALARWLREISTEVDHVVVSLELLVHGGLIPSRNTDDRIGQVLPRLDVLREIDVPVTAFGVVTRLPSYDNAARSRQEPAYWATHGARLGALSTVWDAHDLGEATAEAVAAARGQVPDAYVTDLVRRRARNHAVLLAALEMASDGVLDTLVISSDDTAPRGLPAAERRQLQRWIERLGVDVLTYPGADEVPSVLVARVAAQVRGITPKIAVDCPDADGLDRIAPYEDRPVRLGLANQVRALGAVEVADADEADLVVVVHPPAPEPGDWVLDPPDASADTGWTAVADAVAAHVAAGRRVAVADIRFANGSDPQLLAGLDDRGLLGRLVSYGGWNTAGNTIGTTLAAGVTPALSVTPRSQDARDRFLARKIIEDGHYLPVVRRRLQQEATRRGLTDPPLDELPDVHARITRDLHRWATGTRTLSGWTVTNARLPWSYTFTVDFDLTPPSHAGALPQAVAGDAVGLAPVGRVAVVPGAGQ